MEKVITLDSGEKIIVRSPGLNGEIVIWDFVVSVQPIAEEFQSRFAGQALTKFQIFFEVCKIAKTHWGEIAGQVAKVIEEVTDLKPETIRNDLTLADRIAILREVYDLMGLGKLLGMMGVATPNPGPSSA